MNDKYGCLLSIISIILIILFVLALMLVIDSCTAETWNDGICAECEMRYELRGVSQGLKYYACPECGQEVKRY